MNDFLQFDEFGNLSPVYRITPDGNIEPGYLIAATMAQVEDFYVVNFPDSQTRPTIWAGFLAYNRDLMALIPSGREEQWLNGSFVTDKPNPGDMDVVNYLDGSVPRLLELATFCEDNSKVKYHVHGYVVRLYPESDPRQAFSQQEKAYWLNWFGHDREKRPKAIIRLTPE